MCGRSYAAPAVATASSPCSINAALVHQLIGSLCAPPAPTQPLHCTINVPTMVREVTAELLPSVSADAPLMEAGLDSLGAVELRKQLEKAAGEEVAVPTTLVFDHPTVRQLTLLLRPEQKCSTMNRKVGALATHLEPESDQGASLAGAPAGTGRERRLFGHPGVGSCQRKFY